jgi:hypothetical protein
MMCLSAAEEKMAEDTVESIFAVHHDVFCPLTASFQSTTFGVTHGTVGAIMDDVSRP